MVGGVRVVGVSGWCNRKETKILQRLSYCEYVCCMLCRIVSNCTVHQGVPRFTKTLCEVSSCTLVHIPRL
jgi:hypothetical protein